MARVAKLTTLGNRLATFDARKIKPAPKQAESFYTSRAWIELRDEVIRERGRSCQSCGKTGTRIFVDHIVERRDGGPALDKSNLQLMCGGCHTSKSMRERAKRLGIKRS